jgi:hypothetical protein
MVRVAASGGALAIVDRHGRSIREADEHEPAAADVARGGPRDGASAKPIATAASTAFPPFFITSAPIREAISVVDAAITWRARTGSRNPANAGDRKKKEERAAVFLIGRSVTRRLFPEWFTIYSRLGYCGTD